MTRFSRFAVLGLASSSIWLAGCSMQLASTGSTVTPGVALHGVVHGGQQPVSGATIQLYAANTTGYASTSFALLTTAVSTDVNGGFSISGDYTCPASTSQVYMVATGGFATTAAANPNLALMSALGNCGNLNPSTFISVNELTTVASVWALAPFMSSYTNVGTSATNVQGLTNAFAAVSKLSNIASGTTPGTLPTGAVVPTTEINTLADILAACINSTGGTAGQANACGQLFTAATPAGGVAPTDTIAAAFDIARNPQHNVSALLMLATPTAPFQPTLASASDFTISVKYGSAGLSTPSASAIDPTGNVWVTNAGSNTASVFSTAGSPLQTVTGLSAPSGVAIDAAGNAWITNRSTSTLSKAVLGSGLPTSYAPTGLNAPSAISIDGNGLFWITNGGNNSVAAVAVNGTTATSTVYTGAGITTPVAVAINPH